MDPKRREQCVEDVQAFATKHGISFEEAQDLIDRIGCDLQALEDAALVKDAEGDDDDDSR